MNPYELEAANGYFVTIERVIQGKRLLNTVLIPAEVVHDRNLFLDEAFSALLAKEAVIAQGVGE